MTRPIEIIDRGRGPQLSTSRVTVQDLVPYFLRNCTYAEINEGIPSLSAEEVQVVERYFQDHRDEMLAQDSLIRARAASRTKPPEVEHVERAERRVRLERARQKIHQQTQGRNSDLPPR
jgi:uncharacterized protein (DUF433 family)